MVELFAMNRLRHVGRIASRVKAILTNAPPSPLHERYPEHEFGRGTYGDDLEIKSWGEGAKLRIGAFTSIAAGVQIFLGGEHRTEWVTTFPFSALWPSAKHIAGHPKTKGDVVIGSDVWLGTGALISSGVTIGHGAVIGARAVITRNVAPYTIVVGNPAKVVRERFTPQQIEKLLAIEWWSWPDERIERAMPALLSPDIDHFIREAEAGVYSA